MSTFLTFLAGGIFGATLGVGILACLKLGVAADNADKTIREDRIRTNPGRLL
jgi:hypothetical protein